MSWQFEDRKPRVGQTVTYYGPGVGGGVVVAIEGNLCWCRLPGAVKADPFIWRFRDGLNRLHSWPTKEGR